MISFKNIALSIVLTTLSVTSFAQAKDKGKEALPVFTFVEQMPEFPGGNDKVAAYLARTIRYPEKAREADVEGRVTIRFVVDETGNIVEPQVLHGIGGGCDEEAMRAVKSMPRWKPGTQEGKPVKVYYTLPITFRLEGSSNKVYDKVQQMPEFPGGKEAMQQYITDNLKYPENARDKKIEGSVTVKCVVNSKGLAVREEIEFSTLPADCNEEALRLVRLMPRWKPGMQNDIPVNVICHIPVLFNLKKNGKN